MEADTYTEFIPAIELNVEVEASIGGNGA